MDTVVLVYRTGGVFKYRDVHLLAYHLHKHYGEGLRVICLTDTISKEYQLQNVTLVPFPHKEWPGWWSKMNLFSPELEKYRPFLFLDLDTAVVGDIKDIFPKGVLGEGLITLSDFNRKHLLASGVLWIPANNEAVTLIWKEWMRKPQYNMKRYRGDQEFMRSVIGAGSMFWQNYTKKIISYKHNGRGLVRVIPDNISIICFHGKPKIPETAQIVPWVTDYMGESVHG